jgi:ligand-binding sensor domain-containing protein
MPIILILLILTLSACGGAAGTASRGPNPDPYTNFRVYAGGPDGLVSFDTQSPEMMTLLSPVEVDSVAVSGTKVAYGSPLGLFLSQDGSSYSWLLDVAPHYNISRVLFDSSNRLWIASRNGIAVSSDNGASFTTKNHSDGLFTDAGSDDVRDFEVDSNGVVYMVTSGGFAYSTDNLATFHTNSLAGGWKVRTEGTFGAGSSRIAIAENGKIKFSTDSAATFTEFDIPCSGWNTDIEIGAAHRLYVAKSEPSSGCLYIVSNYDNAGTRAFVAKTPTGATSFPPIRDLVLTSSKLCVVTDREIFVSNIDTPAAMTFTSYKTTTEMTFLTYNEYNGGDLIGTDAGLSDGTTASGLISASIYALHWDAARTRLLVGSNRGVAVSDSALTSYTRFDTNDGLLSDAVTAIETNSAGDIILGTRDQGVAVIRAADDSVENYTTTEGLLHNGIGSLAIDSDDRVLIGSLTGIQRTTNFSSFATQLTGQHILQLATGSDGTVYAATETGLFKKEAGGSSYTRLDLSLSNSQIFGVAFDDFLGVFMATFQGLDVFAASVHSVISLPVEHTATHYDVKADGNVVVSANSDGVFLSTDGGENFSKMHVPLGQIHHLELQRL